MPRPVSVAGPHVQVASVMFATAGACGVPGAEGGKVSRRTSTTEVTVAPVESVARTVMLFEPPTSKTEADHEDVPLAGDHAAPFTETSTRSTPLKFSPTRSTVAFRRPGVDEKSSRNWV